MKKVLMLASVASMIDLFNMNNIQILLDLNYEVEVACNFREGSITSNTRVNEFRNELKSLGIKTYDVPIPRNIHKVKEMVKSYKIIKGILESDRYDILHCHSPIGGAISRLAARNFRKYGLKIIYTAHGFHFYKGSPWKSWLLFYPIEKYLSKYTDCLITINNEDFLLANRKFRDTNVVYIPGIGITIDKFKRTINDNLTKDEFKMVSVGQLSYRKNHKSVIKALALLKKEMDITKINYIICGLGELEDDLIRMIKDFDLVDNIHLVGFQQDIPKYLKSSDCFVFPSRQEGLPVSLMEAMAVPLPIICTDIRGNRDLVKNNEGGLLVEPDDIEGFKNSIKELFTNRNLRKQFEEFNAKTINQYSSLYINNLMKQIYEDVIKNN